MLMMMAALYYLARAMRDLAGLKLTEALNAGGNPGDDRP
jgi:hypothetical protein